MAFDIHGDARKLCFAASFQPLRQFFVQASTHVSQDINLLTADDVGYMFTCGDVSTNGIQSLWGGWEALRYWYRIHTLREGPQLPEMPRALKALADQLPYQDLR